MPKKKKNEMDESIEQQNSKTPDETDKGRKDPRDVMITMPHMGYLYVDIEGVGGSTLIVNSLWNKRKQILSMRHEVLQNEIDEAKKIGDHKPKKEVPLRKKQAKGADTLRDPHQEVEEALYRLSDGSYGLPVSGIKKALVRAGGDLGIMMTALNRMFWIEEDEPGVIQIKSKKGHVLREDIVRDKGVNRTPMLRFRPEFEDWKATLRIRFDVERLDPNQLVGLTSRAGMFVGLCELRPEKGYTNGCFRITGVSIDIPPPQEVKIQDRSKKGREAA